MLHVHSSNYMKSDPMHDACTFTVQKYFFYNSKTDLQLQT